MQGAILIEDVEGTGGTTDRVDSVIGRVDAVHGAVQALERRLGDF